MRCLLESVSLPDTCKTKILVPNLGSMFCFILVFHHDSKKWGHSHGCVSCSKRFKENDNENQKQTTKKTVVSTFLRNVKGNLLRNGL